MSPWILSRRQDLLWLQGPALLSLALLAAFAALPPLAGASYGTGSAALWLFLAWGVLLDGTHVAGTWARTFLAPDAAAREGLPGRAVSLAVVLAGPALALLDAALLPQGPSQLGAAGILFRGFLVAAYLWAYFHLVRQHYGILRLYRRKAGLDGGGADTWLLWLGALHPYLRFSLSDAFAASGLPVLVPPELAPALRAALDAGLAVALVAYVVHELRAGARPGPRHLFLAVVLGLHQAAFAFGEDLLAITAVLTLLHDLQYHRLVFRHEEGKGRVPLGGVGRYLALGVALGVAWYVPRVVGVALAPEGLARNVLLGLGWGVAFHHYLVDGRIWRLRAQPSVARALGAPA